jgi:hypothetical protein
MSLLITGNAAKRKAATAAEGSPVAASPVASSPVTSSTAASSPVAASSTAASSPVASSPVASSPVAASSAVASSGPSRPGPAPAAPLDGPPPIPRVKVHATPGEHPLLEFSHPALGLVGLGCWFIFVGTHHQPLAWVAFGILVATIGAGLGWLARSTRAARRGRGTARPVFPPRLIIAHGVTAAGTLILAVLTALAASHP